jgi:hypothetical protein
LAFLQKRLGELEEILASPLLPSIDSAWTRQILGTTFGVFRPWQRLLAKATGLLVEKTLRLCEEAISTAVQDSSRKLPVWGCCVSDLTINYDIANDIVAGKYDAVTSVHNFVHKRMVITSEVAKTLGVLTPDQHPLTTSTWAVGRTSLSDMKLCAVVCKGIDILAKPMSTATAGEATSWSAAFEKEYWQTCPKALLSAIKDMGAYAPKVAEAHAPSSSSGSAGLSRRRVSEIPRLISEPCAASSGAVDAPIAQILDGQADSQLGVPPMAVRRGLKRVRVIHL